MTAKSEPTNLLTLLEAVRVARCSHDKIRQALVPVRIEVVKTFKAGDFDALERLWVGVGVRK